MNYEEACDTDITRAQAIREVLQHGAEVAEFLQDVGDKATYGGEEVLGWLGY